jgi:hypothetical protein
MEKCNQVDEVLERIAGRLGDAHRLKSDRRQKYRFIFGKYASRYASSWLYLVRATRNNRGDFGFIVDRGTVQIGLGHRNGVIYLTPLGQDDLALHLLSLCAQIREICDEPIIVKQINEALARGLEITGSFANVDCYLQSEVLEDELFQENTVDLTKLFLGSGSISPRASNFRKKVRRYSQGGHNLERVPIDFFGNGDMVLAKITERRDPNGQKWESFRLILQEAVYAAKDSMSEIISCIYFGSSNRVEGIYVAQRFNNEIAGLYCSLTSRSTVGITEYMDASFFSLLRTLGVRMLMLGGSETNGVDHYVKKLLPERPNTTLLPMKYL